MRPGLLTIAREWGRIGCIGFGGPPAHIALLRQLCVERRGWIEPRDFEDAIAACNLLPGPASTQLAIFCAWRLRGRLGALVGGICFIGPGLVLILGLAALFVAGSPPRWILAAGAGAGAAVAAVAVQAGWSLMPDSLRRAGSRVRWAVYALAGAVAAATVGPWLVLVLLGASHFDRLRENESARAFLGGAGPAAIGAILGTAIPLTRALSEGWQYAVLAGAAILLFALRRGVVLTLLLAGTAGALIALAGATLPR